MAKKSSKKTIRSNKILFHSIIAVSIVSAFILALTVGNVFPSQQSRESQQVLGWKAWLPHNDAKCWDRGGSCMKVSSCQAQGRQTVKNLCPAYGNDVRCCLKKKTTDGWKEGQKPNDPSTKCKAKYGKQARCQYTYQKCQTKYQSNYCPGDNNFKCCPKP